MQRTSCQLLLGKVSVEKLKSNGVRNRRRVTYFYCCHWINNSWEFSRVCVCSFGLPKSQCTWSAWASGFISRAAGFTHKWHSVTVDKTWIFYCDPFSKLEFMQWKDVDPPPHLHKSVTQPLKVVRLWQQVFWDTDRLLMADYLHPWKTAIM